MTRPHIKLSDWIELAGINYALVYAHMSLALGLKIDTGYDAPWKAVKSSEENKKVGMPGGLLAPLPNADELVVTGHVVAETLAKRFCALTTFDYLQEPSERFKAALSDLKREGL